MEPALLSSQQSNEPNRISKNWRQAAIRLVTLDCEAELWWWAVHGACRPHPFRSLGVWMIGSRSREKWSEQHLGEVSWRFLDSIVMLVSVLCSPRLGHGHKASSQSNLTCCCASFSQVWHQLRSKTVRHSFDLQSSAAVSVKSEEWLWTFLMVIKKKGDSWNLRGVGSRCWRS